MFLWCCRALSALPHAVQGFSVQAGVQGTGALGSLAKFAESFAPELAEKLEEVVPIS